jgi:hypothetical protein
MIPPRPVLDPSANVKEWVLRQNGKGEAVWVPIPHSCCFCPEPACYGKGGAWFCALHWRRLMNLGPIPLVDVLSVLEDLNACGWLDYKIELACGFSRGFVAQLRRRGGVARLFHDNAVRLHGLWDSEMERNPEYVSALTLSTTT